jgi:hypothetical protein
MIHLLFIREYKPDAAAAAAAAAAYIQYMFLR